MYIYNVTVELVFYLVECMWRDLRRPATYTHSGKELFHDQLIAPSISYLNTTTPLPKVNRSAFSEACLWGLSYIHECSVFIECHWLACTDSHLAENHHLTCLWYRPWICLYFVTFWVQWRLILGHFTLKIAGLLCSQPLRGYPPPPHPPLLYM